MKFFALIALVATASAFQVGKSFDAYGKEPCSYHKSEDGTTCIKVSVPCDEEASAAPAHMEDCAPRPAGSTRTNTPEHDNMASN